MNTVIVRVIDVHDVLQVILNRFETVIKSQHLGLFTS